MAVATNFYQYNLQQKDGLPVREYLQHDRHLSSENIDKFQLGYAGEGWDTLYHFLVEKKHYSVILVARAGLIVKKKRGEGYRDYFRNRLMIPIRDNKGRVNRLWR